MKKLVLLTGLLALLAGCGDAPPKGANGVVYKSAVQYNDYIVNRQTTLVKRILEFGKIAGDDLDSAARYLSTIEKEAAVMLEELKGMPPYKKDSALRDAAIRSFTFYRRVLGDDYRRIIGAGQRPGATPEDAEKEINGIVEGLSAEEDKLDKAFQQAQRNFADRHNMRLKENSIQKQVDRELKEQ